MSDDTIRYDAPPDMPYRTLAGNHADDDGMAIDEMFEPASWGPVSHESREYAAEETKVATRLLSRQIVIGSNGGVIYDPVQLFPVDLSRKRLRIQLAAPATLESIAIANPSAGAQWSYTVPAGEILKLASIRYTLTTDANVANRTPGFEILDSTGTVVYSQSSTITQPASLAKVYEYSNAGESFVPGSGLGTFLTTIPDEIVLAEGWVIRSTSVAGQVGDQYSAITLLGNTDISCRLAADKSDCYGAAEFTGVWESDFHTGSVWVYAPDASGPITVNAWSISE